MKIAAKIKPCIPEFVTMKTGHYALRAASTNVAFLL